MDIHKEFTKWAAVRRVKLDGIATHRFPSRGLGIIAEREYIRTKTAPAIKEVRIILRNFTSINL